MESKGIGSEPLNPYNRPTKTPNIPTEKTTFAGRVFTPLSDKENAKATIEDFASQGKDEIDKFQSQSNVWKTQANAIRELTDKFEEKASHTKTEIKSMLKTTYENKKEKPEDVCVPIKPTAAQKALIKQLKAERKSAAQRIRDLKTEKFKTQVNKSLAEMNRFKTKISDRMKTSFFQSGFFSFKRKKDMKSGKSALKSSQDLTNLRRLSNEVKAKARANELEAASIQKALQEKTEVIKSSIRTLAHVESDIRELDSQIKELEKVRERISLVHIDTGSEMYADTTLQESLNQTNKSLLNRLNHQRQVLSGLRSKIMEETKEPDLKKAGQQEFIYESIKDGAISAISEAARFKENVDELPTWSAFRPLNLFLSRFQKPVVANDQSSPYAEAVNDLKKQAQNLEARLGTQKTFDELLPSAQFHTDFANYQNAQAGLVASILIAKEAKLSGSLFKNPPETASWAKEARLQFMHLKEIYDTEKRYVESLLKLEEKLKNQSRDGPHFSDIHQQHLKYVQGLIAGSRLFLNQAESFFEDKDLSETNLKANLDGFFNQLNGSEDFQNYMKLYESAKFIYHAISSNLQEVIETEKKENIQEGLAFHSIQFIQRGPRYELLLRDIYKEEPHLLRATIKHTNAITNLEASEFSSIADYQAATDQIRNGLAK